MTASRKAKARALLNEALDRAHEAFIRMNDTRELCLIALRMLAPPEHRPRPYHGPGSKPKPARKRKLRRLRQPKESIQ